MVHNPGACFAPLLQFSPWIFKQWRYVVEEKQKNLDSLVPCRQYREDAQKHSVYFSGRTTKVQIYPPPRPLFFFFDEKKFCFVVKRVWWKKIWIFCLVFWTRVLDRQEVLFLQGNMSLLKKRVFTLYVIKAQCRDLLEGKPCFLE